MATRNGVLGLQSIVCIGIESFNWWHQDPDCIRTTKTIVEVKTGDNALTEPGGEEPKKNYGGAD